MMTENCFYRKYNPETDKEQVLNLPLKAADIQEVLALGTPSGRAAIEESIRNSTEIFVIVYDGVIEGVFGYADAGNFGIVWMLTTEAIHQKYRKPFLKESKAFIETVSEKFPAIGNLIHIENIRTIHWLKWLGFEFFDVPGTPLKAFRKLGKVV